MSQKEGSVIEIPLNGNLVRIRADEVHVHDIALSEGDFLHVVAEQQGVDLAVCLRRPNGETLYEVDSPNGKYGPEELVAIAPEKGLYRVEVTVHAAGGGSASYTFRETARRTATSGDRELVAADRAYHTLRKRVLKTPQEVIDGLRPVVKLWQARELHRREADTLIPLSRAYLEIGEVTTALKLCGQAVEWYRVLDAPHQLAPALRFAGLAHLRLGESRRAAERLREAWSLSEEQDDHRGVAITLSRLAKAHHQMGEIQRSLDTFERALKASQALDRKQTHALILSDMAAVLLDLHRSREALERYEEAAEIYRRLGWKRSVGIALEGIANASLQMDDGQRSESAAREALATLHPQQDSRSRAIALNTLGSVLHRKGDLGGARRAFENALELARKAEDLRSQAIILTGLGHLQVAQDDPQGGLERHDEALALFEQTDDVKGQASSRVRGAEALHALGRSREGWQRISPALDAIEALRGVTARRDFRLSYFAFRQEYYAIAFGILMKLDAQQPAAGWDARAIAVNDRRLARELLDNLTLAEDPRDGVAPALLREERALEEQLRALARSSASSTQRPERRIAEQIARLHEVRGRIRQAALTEAPPAGIALDVERVQQWLGPDSLLLVYTLGEERGYLWAISESDRTAYPLPGRGEIERTTRGFAVELQRIRGRSQKRRAELGRALSEILLAPVAEQLRGRRRVVLVTEGELQTIPFAALPPPEADAEETFLLERTEIVMLPSISTLTTQRRRTAEHPVPERWLAIFADPVFEPGDPRLSGTASDPPSIAMGRAAAASGSEDLPRSLEQLRGAPLRRLVATRAEADAIRSVVGDQHVFIASGFQASRATALDALSGGYRVLHFATHALLRPEAELAGLILSLFDENGLRLDGFVRTFEISRLNLTADLVVLSACETASGVQIRGEGTLGLAWSFLHAGAARVIASLWKVGDESTAKLMIRLYTHLEAGLAPPAALRQAQLDLLAEPGSKPYDWAGFVFQGDWRRPDWVPRAPKSPPVGHE